MWYLIVSIPDICILSYFYWSERTFRWNVPSISLRSPCLIQSYRTPPDKAVLLNLDFLCTVSMSTRLGPLLSILRQWFCCCLFIVCCCSQWWCFVCVRFLFCFAVLCVQRKLVALLWLRYVLNVIPLLSFLDPSSRWHGLVCSVWLWYFAGRSNLLYKCKPLFLVQRR